MKKLFTVLLLLCSTIVFSQARLYSSYAKIYDEFQHEDIKINFTDKGQLYLSVALQNALILYYFDEDKLCTSTAIVPLNNGTLNAYVEMYNSKYVIISPTKWRMYSNGTISYIELVNYEDKSFFVWQ